jgi:hypothetical protein
MLKTIIISNLAQIFTRNDARKKWTYLRDRYHLPAARYLVLGRKEQ